MTRQQHWALKCNSLNLLSAHCTMFALYVDDTFISKQGRLCKRTLPASSAFNDGRVMQTFTEEYCATEERSLYWGPSKLASM